MTYKDDLNCDITLNDEGKKKLKEYIHLIGATWEIGKDSRDVLIKLWERHIAKVDIKTEAIDLEYGGEYIFKANINPTHAREIASTTPQRPLIKYLTGKEATFWVNLLKLPGIVVHSRLISIHGGTGLSIKPQLFVEWELSFEGSYKNTK